MKIIIKNSSVVFASALTLKVKTTNYQNWFDMTSLPAGTYKARAISADKEWSGNAIVGFTNGASVAPTDPYRAKFLYVHITNGYTFDIVTTSEFRYIYTYCPDGDNNITFELIKIA